MVVFLGISWYTFSLPTDGRLADHAEKRGRALVNRGSYVFPRLPRLIKSFSEVILPGDIDTVECQEAVQYLVNACARQGNWAGIPIHVITAHMREAKAELEADQRELNDWFNTVITVRWMRLRWHILNLVTLGLWQRRNPKPSEPATAPPLPAQASPLCAVDQEPHVLSAYFALAAAGLVEIEQLGTQVVIHPLPLLATCAFGYFAP